MPWIKVTGPSESTVHISVEQIVRIRPPATGEAADEARALIDLSNGQSQATRETVDEIMQLLQITIIESNKSPPSC